MPENSDIKFMQRCLDLAVKAEGMTYPNPMVGSVIVHEGRIIGEGYHIKAGGPHAEVRAVESVEKKELLTSSTLYVNLEPCSHLGKTPPCADMLVSYKIPRVVVGTVDTSDKVSGKGISKLQNAGCEVTTGVCVEECRRLNRRFFTFHEKKRPYITLKWAQSKDGFIDKVRRDGYKIEPNWITGMSEKILVHKWRASEQAILVGAGTIRADNPQLNVREWTGNNPVRIILSGSGSLPDDPAIIRSIGSIIVFTFYPEKIALPGSVVIRLNHNESAARQISEALFGWGVQSLFIEGGAQVLDHFIRTGYWDEARIFHGMEPFKEGIKAPEIKGKLYAEKLFGKSKLETLLNTE
jgi:diaminohydroxyphosphoribosylaminopyrimidine deaminase/5-amino-6-(5-phosphoribosylamino)uracil reductase